MPKTVKVFSALVYQPERGAGPAADGTFIHRFKTRPAAKAFAAGKTCYGSPATVEEEDVPVRIVRRWGMA